MSKTIVKRVKSTIEDTSYLEKIEQLNVTLENDYKSLMRIDHALNRKVVSFQANKEVPFYRWYKYKEGFSAHLVEYYIRRHGIDSTRRILDPFAGSGAALFGASE
jgi:hypothetical protein